MLILILAAEREGCGLTYVMEKNQEPSNEIGCSKCQYVHCIFSKKQQHGEKTTYYLIRQTSNLRVSALPPAADDTTLRLVMDSARPPYTILLITSIPSSLLISIVSWRAVLNWADDWSGSVVCVGKGVPSCKEVDWETFSSMMITESLPVSDKKTSICWTKNVELNAEDAYSTLGKCSYFVHWNTTSFQWITCVDIDLTFRDDISRQFRRVDIPCRSREAIPTHLTWRE